MRQLCHCAFVASIAIPAAGSAAFGQCGEWLPTDGLRGSGIAQPIRSVTVWDRDGDGPLPELLIAAGDFIAIGTALAANIAAWDGTEWRPLGRGVDAPVYALAVHNGQLIAGGEFRNAGGIGANRIARWYGATWQPMGSGMSEPVRHLAVFNNELVAAGEFRFAFGVPARRIARWDGAVWHPLGDGIENGLPSDIQTWGDELVVAGNFTNDELIDDVHAAAWDGVYWRQVEVPESDVVQAVGRSGDQNFIAVRRGTESQMYASSDDGWQPMGGPFHGQVFDIVSWNDQVTIGGGFESIDGVEINNIARWDGESWHGFGEGTNAEILNITSFRGELIACGVFSSADGHVVGNIARWDGSSWSPFGSGFGAITYSRGIMAFAEHDGRLVAAGSFESAGDSDAVNIASWDGDQWQPLEGAPDGPVSALARVGDDLFVSGLFATAGGVQLNNVARYDGAWHPLGAGVDDQVHAIAPRGDQIVIGGEFLAAGGNAAPYIASWDGQNWQRLGVGPDGPVQALCYYNNDLIAGGTFTRAGSSIVNRIARWDGEAWYSLGDGLTQSTGSFEVLAAMQFGSDLIIGGRFNEAGHLPARNVARWNGAAWEPLGEGIPEPVYALGVHNGQLFACGTRIARWNGTAWETIDTDYCSAASALFSYLGELHIGAAFIAHNGNAAGYWARWTSGEPFIHTQPNDQTAPPGADAAFTIGVSGIGSHETSYHWRLNGAPLKDGPMDETLIEGASTPTLVLSNVTAAVRGGYDCVVTNDCDTTTSAVATLDICISDFNTDGAVNSQDFFDYLNAFFALAPEADINADAIVNSQDFFEFLRAFFLGC